MSAINQMLRDLDARQALALPDLGLRDTRAVVASRRPHAALTTRTAAIGLIGIGAIALAALAPRLPVGTFSWPVSWGDAGSPPQGAAELRAAPAPALVTGAVAPLKPSAPAAAATARAEPPAAETVSPAALPDAGMPVAAVPPEPTAPAALVPVAAGHPPQDPVTNTPSPENSLPGATATLPAELSETMTLRLSADLSRLPLPRATPAMRQISPAKSPGALTTPAASALVPLPPRAADAKVAVEAGATPAAQAPAQAAAPVAAQVTGQPIPQAAPQTIPPTASPTAPPTAPSPKALKSIALDDTLAAARAMADNGQLPAAVQVLHQAIDAPDFAAQPAELSRATVRELARLELLRKDGAQALALLQRHAELLAEDGPAWSLRGNAAQRLGRHGEAIEAYRRALALRPSDAQAALGAALSHAARGDPAGAASLLALARRIGPVPAEVLRFLQQQGVPIEP